MAISVAGGVRPGKVIEIEHRLYQQLIVGKQKSSSMFDELGEDIEHDANKLAVEREAAIERLAKKVEDKQVFERVSKQLVDAVEKAIDHRLASVDSVIKSSGINESQLLILELVQERVIDTNRLISLIENESWLVNDLLNIVNSASFRHRKIKDSDIKVTDVKLILNFIYHWCVNVWYCGFAPCYCAFLYCA